MTGISHATTGITAGIILSEKMNVNPLLSVGLCTLGSLVVDIDAKNSLINTLIFKLIKGRGKLAGAAAYINKNKNLMKIVAGGLMQLSMNPVAKYIGFILILSSICNKFEVKFSLFGGVQVNQYHRTIFHDPVLGPLLLAAPLFMVDMSNTLRFVFIVGLALHYLLDSFTDGGLYSIVLRKFFRMPIHFKSGNKAAELILVSGCIAYLVYSKALFSLI